MTNKIQNSMTKFTSSIWNTYATDYRLQTNEPDLAMKLLRDQFSIISYSQNSDHWIFSLSFETDNGAIQFLKNLTNKIPVQIDDCWVVRYNRIVNTK
mgnify:CR=1 FL=1|jgi:hypothetical protein